jgi:cation diffusion facilitator family transporter
MIQFLAKHLIKDYENISDQTVRRAYGVLCGCVGIALNLLLFAGKLLAGILSRSIAVTADAVNNLSDAGSSIVTLLGFKLAAQAPDRDHPFGHGRLEYVSGLVVSMVILLMGVELGKTSIDKIFHPEPVTFSPVVAVILCVSILVKLYMVFYNRSVGRKISSAAMAATAADSLSDCLATGAVLLGTLAGHFWNLQIDGWCGGAVALFILWSGFGAAKATVDPLLGQPPSPEFVGQIHTLVRSRPEIIGIHDLIVHDYGPGRRILSLHAEVPASGDILELHDVVDALEKQLNEELGCLATIHMDPVVNDGGLTTEARERVAAMVRIIDPAISIHDFRMVPGPTHTKLIFDVEVPFQCSLPDQEVRRRVQSGVQALDEGWSAVVEVEKSYV